MAEPQSLFPGKNQFFLPAVSSYAHFNKADGPMFGKENCGSGKVCVLAKIRRMRIPSSIKGFCHAKDLWRQLDIQGLHDLGVHHDGEILLL
jgi:hypothetical protein